jgi:arginase family enzyme
MTVSPPFLGFPDRLAGGRMPCAVIFGAGHGSTYPGKDSSGYALAADAIRAASQNDAALVEHWDFDLGGPLFDGKPVCCIDAGDIPTAMHDNAGNRARIEAKTREILALPAVPILLGGDDSLPIPFIASFADHGPVWILQIDAHIDWRDELHGERYGYSNPMRRASEMPHVAGIVQVGIRSVGSARVTEIDPCQAVSLAGDRAIPAGDLWPRNSGLRWPARPARSVFLRLDDRVCRQSHGRRPPRFTRNAPDACCSLFPPVHHGQSRTITGRRCRQRGTKCL